MNKTFKKTIVFAMIGLMQVGLISATVEASPKHDYKRNDRIEERMERREDRIERRQDRLEQRQERIEERQRQLDARERQIREEKWRHEREMQRRHNEQEWEWHQRQERERERHDNFMRTIGGIALLAMIIDNNN